MSFNYRKAGALVRNIDKPEFGARVNVNHKGLDGKLLITTNLAARMLTEHAADYGAFEKAIAMNPTAPVYDPDDPSLFFEPGGGEYNPIAVMEQQHREYKSTSFPVTCCPRFMEGLDNCHVCLSKQLILYESI